MRPLINANLPDGKVKAALVNAGATDVIKGLEKLRITVYKVPDNPYLSGNLSSHADMNYFHYQNNELYCYNGAAGEWHRNFTLFKVNPPFKPEYPYDVALNCVRIGNRIILNEKSVSKSILDRAYKDGLSIINTRQGYSKCSVCVLNADAIMTDDPSVYKAASPYFDDVIFLNKGSIHLTGADYGFIGGCTGKLDKDVIAFCGQIESHSDCNLIIDSLSKHKLRAAELTGGRLEDIGSVIPVMQE